MELVYLWVEDYKNIHNQGFNFSPKFNCNYDPDTNALTIDENDDYIENFFGDNINVTAIVGKNGSGKSSLLKIMRQIACEEVTDESFLVFYKNNKYTITPKKEIKCNKTLIDCNSFYNDSIMPLFDYSFTYDKTLRNSREFPVYPKKSKGSLSFEKELMQNKMNIINNHKTLKKKNIHNIFEDFFEPCEILISIDLKALKPSNMKNELKSYKDNFKKPLSTKKAFENIDEIHKLISKRTSYKKTETQIFREIWMHDTNMSKVIDEELYLDANSGTTSDSTDTSICYELKQLSKVNKIKNIEKENSKNDVYTLFKLDVDADIRPEMFNSTYFKIDLIDRNGRSLNDLSFGEQQLIFILNQIHTLGDIPDVNILDDVDFSEIEPDAKIYYEALDYIILLDEIDIGFHPDWQKRVFGYILDFLQKEDLKKKYHIILSTHSPFLLSDIPKQNIIFLDTDEEGKCKVVDGLKEKKQTFGANIHTLLSDSFFMEDGLMGEFAKGKIEEIIHFHKVTEKQKHKTCLKKIYEKRKRKFWQTQSIIGEEYLKQIIKNHLVEIEKILLGKDEAKKQEIERTETYLKSLKND